jgi:hypothetical protein
MKSIEVLTLIVGAITLLPTVSFASTIAAQTLSLTAQPNEGRTFSSHKISAAVECSPIKGVWRYEGKGIPVRYDSNHNVISVNMSNFGRPNAKGRMLSATQIEVNFPDDATFVGTLNGQGKISWSNGTEWQANVFYGDWKYEGKYGPKISPARANSDEMKIYMSKYGRPPAFGNKIGHSQATFNFPDDATHTATLVSPSCMQWSNGTTWTQ